MRPEGFFLSHLDKNIEALIGNLLGNEAFSYDPKRLKKHYTKYKNAFESKNIPIITIGGTNGKGEVSLIVEDILLKNDFEVYYWSSPHFLTVRERFSINGRAICPETFLKLFDEKKQFIEDLSYYEYLFLLFLEKVYSDIPKMKKPVLLFEVGLGGRLDAVNFFNCTYSAITNIGRDHVDILGPKLRDILFEKIHISRPQRPLFTTVTQKGLRKEIKKWCREHKVPLYDVLDFEEGEVSFKKRNQTLALSITERFFRDFGESTEIDKSIGKLWGRPFEVTYEGGQFILVGSHNLDGLRALASWINQSFSKIVDGHGECFHELWVGLSGKDPKEVEHIIKLIQASRCLGRVVKFFDFNHPRATSSDFIRGIWKKFDGGEGRPIHIEGNWKKAFLQDFANRKILITVSNYFVSDILLNSSLFQNLTTLRNPCKANL